MIVDGFGWFVGLLLLLFLLFSATATAAFICKMKWKFYTFKHEVQVGKQFAWKAGGEPQRILKSYFFFRNNDNNNNENVVKSSLSL